MATRDLTAARLRELLHYEQSTGLFTWRGVRGGRRQDTQVAGSLHKASGYIRICVDWEIHLAHRLAWLYVTGEHPSGLIDHINMTRSDNRWSNLRDATAEINQQNKRIARSGTRSGLLGVWRAGGRSKKWTSSITSNGVRTYLGKFATPELAHEAYVAAKRRLHQGCTI